MSASTRPTAPVVRLDSLTSLRWWAAFAVFLFHMRNMITFPSWMHWFVEHGHYGVTFFFVLSGFVLTWSWRRETPVRAFYWRRFARIYPLHLLALLVAIPVFYRIVPPADQGWIKPLDWGVLLLSVLVIQGWWRNPAIQFSGNPAAWTLTVEAFFYALHPLAVRLMAPLRKRGALWAAAGVIAVALLLKAAALLWPATPLGDLRAPVSHLPEFLLGMLLAWAYRHGWRLRMPLILPFALLVGFLLAVTLTAGASGPAALVGSFAPELVGVLCALLIAAAASRDLDGRRGWLVWRPFVALGEWSFAFYLIHATLMYAMLELVGYQFGSYWRTLMWGGALLAASIVAAWLMHRFVEKPLERRLRSWQDRRLAARRGA
ncbi:acyltransferase [Microbacterium sp.]|uniref:acyltransferase family protein n=1 Tax=Microbacterium sp. TaxID=51671 RepID=UPI00333F5601